LGYIHVGYIRVRVYLGKIELGKNRIDFKSGTVRFVFGLSMFGSLWVGLWIRFELGQVISGHARIRVSLGYGSGYFECLGSD